MVVSRSCVGLISPSPLKRVTDDLAADVLRVDAIEDAGALGVVERVEDLLAHVDAIQRRHRDVHVPGQHQRPEVPQEQRAQQRRDVLTVGVGVREDADLVIAQAVEVLPSPDRRRARSRCRALPATAAPRPARLPRCSGSCRASGMIAWNSRSRACLAEPPAESPSTRNSSPRSGSWLVQSASLPGSAGPPAMRLRATFCDAFKRACALAIASCAIFSPASGCWLSHSAKASLTTPPTNAADSREASRSLVWPGELRVLAS